MSHFEFKRFYQDKRTLARLGEIKTPHGTIATPAFVPVGTQATVKTLTPEELNTLGVQFFFVNTYHMYLRPGIGVIKKFGGLHEFMGWKGPLITDSGGFQVYSLGRKRLSAAEVANENLDPSSVSLAGKTPSANKGRSRSQSEAGQNFVGSPQRIAEPQLVKITEDGVEFRSHWDGGKHLFTPKLSMELQWQLGADIHIAFDDCTPYPVTEAKARQSLLRTHRWAQESLSEHRQLAKKYAKKPYQALYGSVQGSVYRPLREESARFISQMDFDGIAIGGVSVGESKRDMVQVLEWVRPLLPEAKPRHLLGVGEIDDIFALVAAGIDTFDCVGPTRLARMGHLYTSEKLKVKSEKFTIDITKKSYAEDKRPIAQGCGCYTCQHFSRGYLQHLFRVRELLAYRLATIHNLYFVNNLMAQIRRAIVQGKLVELKQKWLYDR